MRIVRAVIGGFAVALVWELWLMVAWGDSAPLRLVMSTGTPWELIASAVFALVVAALLCVTRRPAAETTIGVWVLASVVYVVVASLVLAGGLVDGWVVLLAAMYGHWLISAVGITLVARWVGGRDAWRWRWLTTARAQQWGAAAEDERSAM